MRHRKGVKNMVNVNKLKGKIVECGYTLEKLSEIMGINRSTLYRKMADEGKDFTIREVDSIAHALNLSYDEVNAIFFSQFVA